MEVGSPGSGVSGPLRVLLRLDRAQLRVAHKRSLWEDIPLIHQEKSQVQQVSRVPYKVCSDTHCHHLGMALFGKWGAGSCHQLKVKPRLDWMGG